MLVSKSDGGDPENARDDEVGDSKNRLGKIYIPQTASWYHFLYTDSTLYRTVLLIEGTAILNNGIVRSVG